MQLSPNSSLAESTRSDCARRHNVPNKRGPAEIAAVLAATWALGLPGGAVVANPIPVQDEIPAAEIGVIIEQALADADRLGVTGKDITPYLLGRIVEITGGASLTANIALVKDNARLGTQIAVEWSQRAG